MSEEIKFWQAPTMADVYAGEDKKLFTHVSLFAGLGGSSTGMRLAGAHTLGISEFIDYRNDIYSRNYPKCQVWPEDIRELTGEELLRRIGLKKGELDLLDGSPPCVIGSTKITIAIDSIGSEQKIVDIGNHSEWFNKNVYVKSMSSKDMSIVWKLVTDVKKTGVKEVYTIGNNAGRSLTLTKNHRVAVYGHPPAYNSAGGLYYHNNDINLKYKTYTDLYTSGTNNYIFCNISGSVDCYMVSIIDDSCGVVDVYDLSVNENDDEEKTFFANDILIHNCSDFSTNNMGKREKQWGNEKKYSNKRQRVDDLFYEFARVLKEVQPKVFVAENVKGLTVGNAKTILGDRSKSISSLLDIEEEDEVSDLSKFNGKDETIVETLRACGYKVSYQVMNCAHYGIPQIRERLIFIGIRNDLPYSPSFPKPFTKTKQIIGKDAIGNFLFNGGNVILNPETMTYDYVKRYFPPHTTKLQVLNKMKDEKFGTYAHRYHRDNWDKVFYTIVAQDGNNVIHSLVDRYWSVCEAKKIQGFPDDFNDGLPPFKRIKVSASDLINPDFYTKVNYKWKDQGHASGDIIKLIELARWKWDEMKDQKIFDLDLETEYDKTQKYLHSSKSWENLGRAVPPLLYKAVGEHIYENVLKHLK